MLIDFAYLSKKYKVRPKGVLHVGAHYGQEAEHYAKMGVEKMIFIEAIPDVYEKLKQNIAKYPKAVAINACVSDVDNDEVIFNVASNEGQSSSFLQLGTHKTAHPDVKYIQQIPMTTTRIDRLGIDFNDLDFLNVDLQGAELKALKGMGFLLHQFQWAYIEVNQKELYVGCPLITDIDLFMMGFGFYRKETKMFDHWGWGDAFYSKVK